MSDIAQWLDTLALGRYAQSFAENDIEWRVLPQLTDDDLRELGVSLGHRKLMMQAIAVLGAGAAVCETTNTASATLPVNERRFLIVMFCDLVGSTERAASMDPEDWRDLAAEYHRRTAQAVTRFNGYVAKNLGDGVMVYFGYPQAQESDAERAVHAGLAILDAMALMASELAEQGKAALEVRVGIHAGAMVLDGSADVFGDVPNIAARVQSAAAAGTLLISPALHDTLAHLFIVDDLGPHALKGVAAPLNLFRVVRPSQAQGKLQSADLTALIGRQEEILILQKRWQRACTGAGQLVLIEAEPGLGKSRLIEEMRRQLPEHGPLWVTWRCSHMLQGARFHPLVEWARRRFGGPEQAAPQRLANFESALAAVGLDLNWSRHGPQTYR